MTEDKLDELLTELQNKATDISLELAKNKKNREEKDMELKLLENMIEQFTDNIATQAYNHRTYRRVLKQGIEK